MLLYRKGPFPLRAWKRAFFRSFIDLRLKRAVKIEARAKKSNKTNKECFFSTLVVETGLNSCELGKFMNHRVASNNNRQMTEQLCLC